MKRKTGNMILSALLAVAISLSGLSAMPAGAAETVTLQEGTGTEGFDGSISENDGPAGSAADLAQDMADALPTITADEPVAVDCTTAGTTYSYQFTKTEAVSANGIVIARSTGYKSPSVKIYEISGEKKTLKDAWYAYEPEGVYFPFEDGKTYELEVGMSSASETGTYSIMIIYGAKPIELEFSISKNTVELGEVLPVTCSKTLDDNTLKYKYDKVEVWDRGKNWQRKSRLFSDYSDDCYIRPLELGTYNMEALIWDFLDLTKTITFKVVPPTIRDELKPGDTKNFTIDGKGFVVYSFVPEEDDVYVFEASGADGKEKYNVEGYLFDKDFKQISHNLTVKLSIRKELKKGETYYFATMLDSVDKSERSINISLKGTKTETVTEVPVVVPVKPADNSDSVYIGAMKMDYKKLTLAKGRSFCLTLYTEPAVFDSVITWESSRPKVATVNQKGVVRAKMAGKSAVITATTSEGLVASCVVKVPKKEVKSTGVTVKKNEVTLSVGKTSKIKAKMKPGNTTDNVTYKSKNPKVATVSSRGTITAVKKGKTKITVKTTSGKKTVVTVIVK